MITQTQIDKIKECVVTGIWDEIGTQWKDLGFRWPKNYSLHTSLDSLLNTIIEQIIKDVDFYMEEQK